MRKFSLLGLIGVGSLLFSSAASATSLISPSVANIAGTVKVDNTGVFFSNLIATGPNTGSFSGITGVTMQNLVGAPTTGAVPIPAFATFTGGSAGTVTFDLQNIFAGVGSAAGCASNTVGNVCTPVFAGGVKSPFTLVQAAPSEVTISLSLSGIAYTGTSLTGSSAAPFSFTSQNTMPGTITDIIAAAESSTGFTNSFSAEVSATSAVPEPASFMLMGAGLAAAGLVARRRRVRS